MPLARVGRRCSSQPARATSRASAGIPPLELTSITRHSGPAKPTICRSSSRAPRAPLPASPSLGSSVQLNAATKSSAHMIWWPSGTAAKASPSSSAEAARAFSVATSPESGSPTARVSSTSPFSSTLNECSATSAPASPVSGEDRGWNRMRRSSRALDARSTRSPPRTRGAAKRTMSWWVSGVTVVARIRASDVARYDRARRVVAGAAEAGGVRR